MKSVKQIFNPSGVTMNEANHINIEKFCKLITYPLTATDKQGKPINRGSAVNILYKNKNFLLTVYHVIEGEGKWCIDCCYDFKVKKVEQRELTGIHYARLNSEIKPVDFAWAIFPKDTHVYYQEIFESTQKTAHQEERVHLKTDLNILPNPSDDYFFSGRIRLDEYKLKKTGYIYSTENPVYKNFHYLRSEGNYHVFSMPFKNPSLKMFQGCSGAPIINQNRELVSLVSWGNTTLKELYGINLNKFKMMIDVTIMEYDRLGVQT